MTSGLIRLYPPEWGGNGRNLEAAREHPHGRGVLALATAGAAYALTSQSFTYSKTKTGYVVVSPMDFASDGIASGGYSNVWNGGLTSANECLNAGVHLPQGARVKSVTLSYASGAGGDFAGSLHRMMLAAGSAGTLSSVSPADDLGTPNAASNSVASAKQAVSPSYAYGIGICPGVNGTVYGARVKYTYTSAGS